MEEGISRVVLALLLFLASLLLLLQADFCSSSSINLQTASISDFPSHSLNGKRLSIFDELSSPAPSEFCLLSAQQFTFFVLVPSYSSLPLLNLPAAASMF